jgi:citrate lyase beta subunit
MTSEAAGDGPRIPTAADPPDLPDLARAIAEGDDRRRALRTDLATRRADLPLRYWRQGAHFTTPAADPVLARKAVEGGTAAVSRMLDRLGLTADDLADRLELPADLVQARLERPSRAPLVMLDGEDAIAPGDEAAARAMDVAAETFTTADWGQAGVASLRFYRPPGFNLETTVRDLYTLLWRLRARVDDPAAFPLDGIVFPKVEHPEEVELVNALLDRAEADLGLSPGRIRVGYLVESGWAAAQLPDIARAAAPRLASLIFGIADFSADLGLPAIGNEHPLADWARAEIIAVAGAVGVPAVDGMTLDYPVSDPSLGSAADRARWLDRMRLVYDDTVRARAQGLLGKWVGHPAQLLAVLLADEAALSPAVLDREASKLEAYDAAVAADQGATMIAGVMSDRATDRHARVVLRQATASGRFEPELALRLGVIAAHELGEARQARAAHLGEVA